MARFVIKIAGESGTGIESSGVIVMKALKKMGYWVTADREFPSLIKGGCANYQINFSDRPIKAMSKNHRIGVAVDREGVKSCLETLQPGSLLINGFEKWPRVVKNMEKEAQEKQIEIIHLPATTIAKDNGGSNLMVNVVVLGTLWRVLGFDLTVLKDQVAKQFGKKPQLLEINLRCLQSGYDFIQTLPNINLSDLNEIHPNPEDGKQNLLIDGNTALCLGAIHCGVRAYYAYPMSPASSILSYLAKTAFDTGIVVKQAEDEITAAQMALGSMHVGARAFTATSGGGYDLMTETVSLAGMIETPMVVVIAQRPGPATGLPTWTGQGDLNLAIYSSHGEFARVVMACSDPSSAFENIQHAFNLAETFQCPTILLTEKTIAESKTTVSEFQQNKIPITRGLVATEELETVKPSDRYEITDSGVSKRWLPGKSKTIYFANGDEHHEDGSLDETEGVGDMIWKRVKKIETIRQALPEPEIFGQPSNADISFVGWGSSKNAVLDAIGQSLGYKINYLHFTYLWPLKTDKLKEFFANNLNVHLIEGNATGQLGQLIAKEADLKFAGKLLKWNGRSFYLEDVLEYIKSNLKRT